MKCVNHKNVSSCVIFEPLAVGGCETRGGKTRTAPGGRLALPFPSLKVVYLAHMLYLVSLSSW